jgi:asparagine synthase (glutamine-hydrolysing)
MCGIAGALAYSSEKIDDKLIHGLLDSIAHRGPDGEGCWIDGDRKVGLGHRRLAILDTTEGGHQPMASSNQRYVMVYNGEVYNFLELRRELETLGHQFVTASDTEVILAAWSQWQEDMLYRLNGMWALAIYDNKTNELFLARDRFGIKPLLYSLSSKYFFFASETRALVSCPLIDSSPRLDSCQRLLIDPFGMEGSKNTLYRNINRLQAGHYMWLRGERIEEKRWWRSVDHLPSVPTNQNDQAEVFYSLFRDSISLRMRSDVPIGTCLSGGFDSSAVLCTMSAIEQNGSLERGAQSWRHAFVAAFPGMMNDERPEAELAAQWANVNPTIIEIGRDDGLDQIERILDDMDDPYISLPSAVWTTYRKLRSERVLVSLDGHGADELMGGYRQGGQSLAFHLRNIAGGLVSHHPTAGKYLELARASYLKRQGQFFLRGRLRDLPPAFKLVGDDDVLPENWGNLNRRLYKMFHATVLPTILRNFDRLSMAHGVEVRMPFMDWRLATYAMNLPDSAKSSKGYSKWTARLAMKDKMPEQIRMGRRKVGFNSPMPEWLNGSLSEWATALMDQDVPAFDEIVDNAALKARVRELTNAQGWSWESVGRIWPYLHLKRTLSQL